MSSSFLYLDKEIEYGVYSGHTPATLIKNKNIQAIEYFIDLRENPHSRVKLQTDLHHVLDSIIRSNQKLSRHETRFTRTEYDLWLAEKRVKKITEEKLKKAELEKKKTELQAKMERQRLEALNERKRLAEEAREARLKQIQKENDIAKRAEVYSTNWAAW